MSIKPLFMWAGGKGKMIKHYAKYLPECVEEYVEPCIGGGAMFCYVMNNYNVKKATINDYNESIVSIYRAIKNAPFKFCKVMDKLSDEYLMLDWQGRRDYYYFVRTQHAWNYKSMTKVEEAATLYFLMKTSFNGIWQTNRNTNYRFGASPGKQIGRAHV